MANHRAVKLFTSDFVLQYSAATTAIFLAPKSNQTRKVVFQKPPDAIAGAFTDHLTPK